MKKLIYLLPLMVLFSCTDKIQPGEMYIAGNVEPDVKEKIRYFQDKETGVCFAERGLGDSYTFTEVKCTNKVLNKIYQGTIFIDTIFVKVDTSMTIEEINDMVIPGFNAN